MLVIQNTNHQKVKFFMSKNDMSLSHYHFNKGYTPREKFFILKIQYYHILI